MMSDRLNIFRAAYRNLDLLPLTDPNELKKFRVEYGTRVLAELEQLVEDDDSQSGKIIFAGHRGCGKSTRCPNLGGSVRNGGTLLYFSRSPTRLKCRT